MSHKVKVELAGGPRCGDRVEVDTSQETIVLSAGEESIKPCLYKRRKGFNSKYDFIGFQEIKPTAEK